MAAISELPESIKRTSIREFILPDIPQVKLTDSLTYALNKYKESPYPALLVVDASNQSLAGMITDNDLVGQAGAGPIGAILPKDPVIAIRNDATLSELLDIINGGNTQKRVLDKVPVVDPANNKPLGIVDRDKLTIRIGEMLAKEVARR